MSLRVLIADDHPVVRGGLRALIETLDGLEVVGEAADGETTVREAQLLRPDVVLMDVRMPGLDGVEATRRIRAGVPETAVLMLTMYDDDATVFTAMQAGARGYLLKGAAQEEIVAAIRAVVAGQAIFGPGVAARVLGYFTAPPTPRPDPFPELTEREREILDLLASGRRTDGDRRGAVPLPKTVSNHLTSIFAKLEVADRTAAIIRAREGGLGIVIAYPALLALAALGVSSGIAAVAMLGVRRVRPSAVLVVFGRTGHPLGGRSRSDRGKRRTAPGIHHRRRAAGAARTDRVPGAPPGVTRWTSSRWS